MKNSENSFSALIDKIYELEDATSETLSTSQKYFKEWLDEASEVTHEEAERLSYFLGEDWKKFTGSCNQYHQAFWKAIGVDTSQFTVGFKQWLTQMAQKEDLGLKHFNDVIAHSGVYEAGEPVLSGALKCTCCGCEVEFEEPGVLEKCMCGCTTYRTVEDTES